MYKKDFLFTFIKRMPRPIILMKTRHAYERHVLASRVPLTDTRTYFNRLIADEFDDQMNKLVDIIIKKKYCIVDNRHPDGRFYFLVKYEYAVGYQLIGRQEKKFHVIKIVIAKEGNDYVFVTAYPCDMRQNGNKQPNPLRTERNIEKKTYPFLVKPVR